MVKLTMVDLSPLGQFTNLQDVSIQAMIAAAVTLVLILAAISFVFSLLFGGIRWILSGGAKDKADAARSQVANALIGIVIVFSAWAIIQFVNEFFGVNLLLLEFPTL